MGWMKKVAIAPDIPPMRKGKAGGIGVNAV